MTTLTLQSLIGKTVSDISVKEFKPCEENGGNVDHRFITTFTDDSVFTIERNEKSSHHAMKIFQKISNGEIDFSGKTIHSITSDMNFYECDISLCFGQIYDTYLIFTDGTSYDLEYIIYSTQDADHAPKATMDTSPLEIHEERETYE